MDVVEQLISLGMGAANAEVKRALYAECDHALDAVRVQADRRTAWVPGRIEVLGKHTDYAGGRSLVCAVERGFAVRFRARADANIRVIDVARREQFQTKLDPSVAGHRGEWSNYVATVARRFARDFPSVRKGVDIALSSDLPPAAGLSSSTALVVAVSLAILDANAMRDNVDFLAHIRSNADLGGYLGAVENGRAYGPLGVDSGVGTFGGSEDHVAELCGVAGRLVQYSYAPVRAEGDVAVPDDCTWVVGASGVTANKAGDAREKYNRLSVATAHILAAWNRETGRFDGTLAAAIDSDESALARLMTIAEAANDSHFSSDFLKRRLEQFHVESYVVVNAAREALGRHALQDFGTLVDRSHMLAETHLGNQIPETISLQRLARRRGAFAASAFGAGFGGSVWALVGKADAADFATGWEEDYRRTHRTSGRRSVFFVTPAGPPASVW